LRFTKHSLKRGGQWEKGKTGSATMSEIQIDRLTVHVPGLSETAGRRLALRIAEGLGSALVGSGDRVIPNLQLDLVTGPNPDPDDLARRVVDELVRQLNRIP
jgi:hypothetical protein